MYTGPITISGTLVLRATAVGVGHTPTKNSWTYIQDLTVLTLNAAPDTYTYSTSTLDITLVTNGDRIYYTINGSDPDTNNASQLYTGPITISGDVTVKAIAIGESFEPSTIEKSWTYTQELQNTTLTADPEETNYTTATLEITLTTNADQIYYTTDGSVPDTTDASQLYTGPITISGTVILRATAIGANHFPTQGVWTYLYDGTYTVLPQNLANLLACKTLSIALCKTSGNSTVFNIGVPLKESSVSQLYIFDLSGRKIAERSIYGYGYHRVVFSRNSGVHIVKLKNGDTVIKRKFVLR